jgi:uncharacterized protein (TIGR02145 family)
MAQYYIRTDGSDSNTGLANTAGGACKTLASVCGKATAVGDVINVGVGTFIESQLCVLRPGVSIVGAGVTSIIKSHVANTDGANDGLIELYSSTQNYAGNQSISNIKLDGDALQGGGAIYIYRRGNVSIHDCTIVDFKYCGVVFDNELSWVSPGTFAVSNSLYNNIITNCHGSGGGGNVRLTSQATFSMYGNTIDGRTRGMQNSVTFSNCKAITINNNTFYTLDTRPSGNWNFSFEVWDSWGGIEFHHNNFLGGGTMDLGGHYTYKGAYAFGISVHDNNFTIASRQPYTPEECIAITSESWQRLEDVWIYNNRITNFASGIQVTFGAQAGGVAQNYYIFNNIFEGMGYTDRSAYVIGFVDQNVAVTSYTNINIINNVIVSGANPGIAIRYDVMGSNTNINIKNNIVSGAFSPAVRFAVADYGGTFTNLAVTNNIFFGVGANYSWVGIPSQGTLSPVSASNPNFVSATDFHLKAGSAAIGYGTTVANVTNDLAGNAYANPRSVGVYEYSAVVPVIATITTSSVTGITSTTATTGGIISTDGGAIVTSRGICWATTSNPTIANNKVIDPTTGTGTFVSLITGLTQSTIYHVRAYATNSVGTAYGADIQFVTTTPVVLPTVTTQAASLISYTTATGNGNITSSGGATVTGGFCCATHTVPTTADNSISVVIGAGVYSGGWTGLLPSTTYYLRAWATNSAGTSYGNEVSFTTLTPSAPTVTTGAIFAITQTSATVAGTVTNINGAAITGTGICWSTISGPTITGSHTSDGISLSWSGSLTGLSSNTLYYVRAYATNSAGTSYGTQISFTTTAALPTLNLTSITSITSTTASSGGNTLNDNGSVITAKGICWSTTTTPTIATSHTTDGSGNSNYSSTLSGLVANTLYYVRAYATNSIGTGYSSQLTFTTSPSVTYISVIKAQVKKWMCVPDDRGHGALYNWYVASSSKVAPVGWHVPSNAEFNTLRTFFDPYGAYINNVAGGPLKQIGITHWMTPNTDATNSSGFNGVGSGSRWYNDGTYNSIHGYSFMWGTDVRYGQGVTGQLVANNPTFNTTGGTSYTYADVKNGYNIRFIKDNSVVGDCIDYDGNNYGGVLIGTQVWTTKNFKGTHYNDGTVIPLVTDNNEWIALGVPIDVTNDDSNRMPSKAGATTTINWGQTFPSIGKSLTKVIVKVNSGNSKLGSPDFNIRCSIYNTSLGIQYATTTMLPTTKIADSTNVISASIWGTDNHEFLFNSLSLPIGQYAIYFTYEDVVLNDESNNIGFSWGYSTYPGGEAFYHYSSYAAGVYNTLGPALNLYIYFEGDGMCYYNNDPTYA